MCQAPGPLVRQREPHGATLQCLASSGFPLEEARFPHEKRPQPHRAALCPPGRSLSPEWCLEKPGPRCGAGSSSPQAGAERARVHPSPRF